MKLQLAAAALALVAAPMTAVDAQGFAGRCTDAQGRLTKCPKPAGGAIKCRDAKGKKAKCGLPGTHTVDK